MEEKKKLVDFLKEHYMGEVGSDGTWCLNDERIVGMRISQNLPDVDLETELEQFRSKLPSGIELVSIGFNELPECLMLFKRGNNFGGFGEQTLAIKTPNINIEVFPVDREPVPFYEEDSEIEAAIPGELSWTDIQNVANKLLGPSHPDFSDEFSIIFVPNVGPMIGSTSEQNDNPTKVGERLYDFLQAERYGITSGRFFSDKTLLFHLIVTNDFINGKQTNVTDLINSLPSTLTFQGNSFGLQQYMLVFEPKEDRYELPPNLIRTKNVSLMFASIANPIMQIEGGWKVLQARKPAELYKDDVLNFDWALGNLS